MRWAVAAPFFSKQNGLEPDRWLDDMIVDSRHSLVKIAPPGDANLSPWHARAVRGTPLGDWRRYWQQTGEALVAGEGVISVFPQLAIATGIRTQLARRRTPHVAWCFNIGKFPKDMRRQAARAAMRHVDRIVVHARAEVDLVRDFLGVGPDVVRFAHLQRAEMPELATEDTASPFLLAMGSANRDYPTLVEALRRSGLPAKIVAAPRLLSGLDVPANVELVSNLSPQECWRLAQRARISVVPLEDSGSASGQVTVVEALRMGRPVVATRSIGTEDYISDGETGRLVQTGNPELLAEALEALWNDASGRERMAAEGARFALEKLSDAAAARTLVSLLDEIAE